ncbi:MAG TPA: NUDIX hydrolase [Candidatus Yaniella excrementigallinarum]|nr:NUDIX hydrolase [Candidatus Yaniella excrementigallinarum]
MTSKPIKDTDRTVTIEQHQTVFRGAIWDIQRDTFTIADTDDPMTREYIQHPGAVAIVAVDQQQRVVLINQYRHPVGQDCWEIPAGLCDVSGESQLGTAQRELAEETDLVAEDWSILIDHYPSSGSSTEAIRIFLAQDLRPVPQTRRHQRADEEAHLTIHRIPLDEVLEAILDGRVRNSNAVAGVMATHLVLNSGHQQRSTELS